MAVVNYGHLAADDATLKKIHAAILGIFGGKDQGIPVADVDKFQAQMKALDKRVEIHIFPTPVMPSRTSTIRKDTGRTMLPKPGSIRSTSWPEI